MVAGLISVTWAKLQTRFGRLLARSDRRCLMRRRSAGQICCRATWKIDPLGTGKNWPLPISKTGRMGEGRSLPQEQSAPGETMLTPDDATAMMRLHGLGWGASGSQRTWAAPAIR